MPRKYARKSNRGVKDGDLRKAADSFKKGSNIRAAAAANEFNIVQMTLKRYINDYNERNGQ